MTTPDFWHVIWPAFWFGLGGAWIGYGSCAWVQHHLTRRRLAKHAAQQYAAKHSIELPRTLTPRATVIDVARNRRNLHIHTGFDHDD